MRNPRPDGRRPTRWIHFFRLSGNGLRRKNFQFGPAAENLTPNLPPRDRGGRKISDSGPILPREIIIAASGKFSVAGGRGCCVNGVFCPGMTFKSLKFLLGVILKDSAKMKFCNYGNEVFFVAGWVPFWPYPRAYCRSQELTRFARVCVGIIANEVIQVRNRLGLLDLGLVGWHIYQMEVHTDFKSHSETYQCLNSV